MRVDEIAKRLNAEWEGAGDLEIHGAADLDAASPDDIAFVQNRKAATRAEASRAGCLIVDRDFPAGRTVIRVSNPRAAFAMAIGLLYPKPPITPGIHPTAVIAPDATIAASASIGPHVTVGPRAVIGERTVVGPG